MRVTKLAENLKNYNNSIWHGGKVATIECNKGIYNIYANGIVNCNLIAKRVFIDAYGNIYGKDDIIETVKDKNNSGEFLKRLGHYITDDEHLKRILEDKDKNYELEIINNNWLELEYINNTGEIEYSDVILDFANITDAIDNVLEQLEKENETNKKFIIYCRIGMSKDNPYSCESQKKYCMSYLKGKYNINEEQVEVYMDEGFSGVDHDRPCFKMMLERIKEGNIKQIITPSFSRICRDLETSFVLIKLLEKYYVDLYSIKENSSLKDIISLSFNKSLFETYHQNKQKEEKELEYE